MLAIDGNEPFFNSSRGISRICREYKLFDPLDHKHGDACDSKSFLRGSDRIDFILCSLAILTTVLRCGLIEFNNITSSDHCGFFLDLSRDVLLKGKATTIPSPFEHQLQLKSPKSVRKYKDYLQKQVIKNNIEKQIEQLLIMGKQRKLTQEEETDLNRIYQLITKIMLKAEKSINNQQHNSPRSPALHDAMRIVSIWKSILP